MEKSLAYVTFYSGSILEDVFCKNFSLNYREKKLVKFNNFLLKLKHEEVV